LAVNYAIDRNKLSEILVGAAEPTSQAMPPAFPEYDKSIPKNIYDLDHVSKLLEGFDLPLHVELYAVDEYIYREVVYSIAEDLRRVGIVVTPRYGNHQQIEAIGRDPSKGQIVFSDGLGWSPDFIDPANIYFPLLSRTAIGTSGWNWSAYNNPSLDSLAHQAERKFGPDQSKERAKLWEQVFGWVNKDAPIIPLYNRSDKRLWSRRFNESRTFSRQSSK
jgi:ABC-type transport system substrate-binding protein